MLCFRLITSKSLTEEIPMQLELSKSFHWNVHWFQKSKCLTCCSTISWNMLLCLNTAHSLLLHHLSYEGFGNALEELVVLIPAVSALLWCHLPQTFKFFVTSILREGAKYGFGTCSCSWKSCGLLLQVLRENINHTKNSIQAQDYEEKRKCWYRF